MSSLSAFSALSSSGSAMAENPRLIPEATVLQAATRLISSCKRKPSVTHRAFRRSGLAKWDVLVTGVRCAYRSCSC